MWENFRTALTLMWQGMLGIFIVMAAIAVIVYVITKITDKSVQKKAEKENQQ